MTTSSSKSPAYRTVPQDKILKPPHSSMFKNKLTHAMKLDPEDVPLAVKDWHDLVRRRQTLVDGQPDVQVLELARKDVLGHAVVTSKLFIGDET